MRFLDPRQDCWHRVEGEDGPLPHPDPQADRLLTLEQWHAVRETWPRGLATGESGERSIEFAADQLLDELTRPSPHLGLDRVDPVVEKINSQLGRRLQGIGLRGNLGHGVVSSPTLQRRMIRG